MRIGHIELFVSDPLKSKDFYTNVLGFELTTVQDERFVWLKCGEQEILLRPGKPVVRADQYQAAAVGLVIYTDDVNAAATRLMDNDLQFRGTDGSDECLTFTDPDGNWFQLVTPQ